MIMPHIRISLPGLMILSLSMALLACKEPKQPVAQKPADLKESLIKANKEVAVTENDQIDDLVARFRDALLKNQPFVVPDLGRPQ